ncbi:hypothetical protein MSG28_015170 [Choristoneura fumiferana]|uniref:Uncharacterized protein n=1 Tax=Choristoneura fumiferana TaxID=7141 RepID=A0ACC0KZH4_CHOFU|nr:hypothetical protein MSG28_015170 [Choristoneura fumiferana]
MEIPTVFSVYTPIETISQGRLGLISQWSALSARYGSLVPSWYWRPHERSPPRGWYIKHLDEAISQWSALAGRYGGLMPPGTGGPTSGRPQEVVGISNILVKQSHNRALCRAGTGPDALWYWQPHERSPPRGWYIRHLDEAISQWSALSDRYGGLMPLVLAAPRAVAPRGWYIKHLDEATQWSALAGRYGGLMPPGAGSPTSGRPREVGISNILMKQSHNGALWRAGTGA